MVAVVAEQAMVNMRPLWYRLDKNRNPVASKDFREEEWRRVRVTRWPGVMVSTVFLGLDHNYTGKGGPILFETMIFGAGRLDEEQWRYRTWDEAVAGHWRAVRLVLVAYPVKRFAEWWRSR